MPYYMIEVRDSDGNDCSVYDAIVLAADKVEASMRLWAELRAWYPDDEGDGGYGTYHACDCECEHAPNDDADVCSACSDWWECSHGGLLTDEDCDGGSREYATRDEAMATHAIYHLLIDLSDEEEVPVI